MIDPRSVSRLGCNQCIAEDFHKSKVSLLGKHGRSVKLLITEIALLRAWCPEMFVTLRSKQDGHSESL
jgi:hypothetical protein